MLRYSNCETLTYGLALPLQPGPCACSRSPRSSSLTQPDRGRAHRRRDWDEDEMDYEAEAAPPAVPSSAAIPSMRPQPGMPQPLPSGEQRSPTSAAAAMAADGFGGAQRSALRCSRLGEGGKRHRRVQGC